MKLKMLLAVL